MTTQEKIIKHIIKLYAGGGLEGVSMRKIAGKVGIVQSVLYHYFPDKDTMLRYMFDTINANLEVERAKLPTEKNASNFLKQRITFFFEHSEEIVASVKYFYSYRKTFKKKSAHVLPSELYMIMEEVIINGNEKGEFSVTNIKSYAKLLTYTVHGTLLEYYPNIPTGMERAKLIKFLHSAFLKMLQK